MPVSYEHDGEVVGGLEGMTEDTHGNERRAAPGQGGQSPFGLGQTQKAHTHTATRGASLYLVY